MSVNVEYVRGKLKEFEKIGAIDDFEIEWEGIGLKPTFKIKMFSYSESRIEFSENEIQDFISRVSEKVS